MEEEEKKKKEKKKPKLYSCGPASVLKQNNK
jgi:hypothetical protein